MKNNDFFTWNNIKYGFREIVKIYSNQDSFFSKKRIESGIAFTIAQFCMVAFFVTHIDTLTMGEFLLWAGTEFAVAGYIINQIQKEKATLNTTNEEGEEQL